MGRVVARAREERIGEDLRKKLSKVYTGATRVQSHACTWHVYTRVPSARTLASPPTRVHPHFRVRPPSKNPFNHTHTWTVRGNEHKRGETTYGRAPIQWRTRSRRFRNADTQRQAGYVGNPASPPHPIAATPVVLPPTTTPVAPSFHGCEPL